MFYIQIKRFFFFYVQNEYNIVLSNFEGDTTLFLDLKNYDVGI